MILPILFVAPSPKGGRGVFSSEMIPVNTVIEISPVLVLNSKDRKEAEKTILFDYLFEWGPKRKKACMALGYLSLYNHSFAANCEYEMDFAAELMSIKTIQPVAAGEELFINYTSSADNAPKLWFTEK